MNPYLCGQPIYDKEAKLYNGEKTTSQMVLGEIGQLLIHAKQSNHIKDVGVLWWLVVRILGSHFYSPGSISGWRAEILAGRMVWPKKKKKMWDTHKDARTHKQWTTYYTVIKTAILTCATWMDLEGIMLSEICQTEKDKYCRISLICGIWKNKWINIAK